MCTEMSFKIQTAFLLLISLMTLVNSSPIDGQKNKYCRKHEGVSVCVENPLDIKDEDLWCPYRMCGPSYIPAFECPEGPEQATHKCTPVTVSDPVYRCKEERFHKMIDLPINCKASSCTSQIRTCACETHTPERLILTPEFEIEPICNQ